jgi:2-oxoglutarate ferredoxin oxidoreductase subunit alpha
VHVLEEHNWKLYRKYKRIERREVLYEEYCMEDAELGIVAYGTAARIAKGAVKRARDRDLKVGLVRPITLWPFPSSVVKGFADRVKGFLVFEMSMGQMVEDVRLAVEGRVPIEFYGRPGGVVITPVELLRIITRRYHQLIQKG